jgi:hypothetical protein
MLSAAAELGVIAAAQIASGAVVALAPAALAVGGAQVAWWCGYDVRGESGIVVSRRDGSEVPDSAWAWAGTVGVATYFTVPVGVGMALAGAGVGIAAIVRAAELQ